MKKWLDKQMRKYTHRIWNREIARLLCRAYSNRVIDSEQLHELAAMFDPTNPKNVVNRNG